MAIGCHPAGGLIATQEIEFDGCEWLNISKLNLSTLPVMSIFFVLFKMVTIYLVCKFFFGRDDVFSDSTASIIIDLNIIFVLPNALRTTCIVLMSNCSHYYGDIPQNSLFHQNQILDHWILFPFQIFCCNFGATHIIHHFVPMQPFYIRELVYRRVRDSMESKGIRRNDFGILLRANRYHKDTPHESLPSTFSSKIIRSMLPESFVLPVWCYSSFIIGYPLFIFWDQVTSYFLFKRILNKYILKNTADSTKKLS